MKKQYINPETTIIVLGNQNLLAGSNTWDDNNGTGQGSTNETGATDGALSNEFFGSDNEDW